MSRPAGAPNESLESPDLQLLAPLQRDRLVEFQNDLRSCDDDEEKYQLCVKKRDDLLAEKDGLEFEFVFYEHSFLTLERYHDLKDKDPHWKRFAATAANGARNQLRRDKELKTASSYWGEDLVQRHAMAKGVGFAIKLASAARTHPNWEKDALPRLQQLVNRRIQVSGQHGRHKFGHPLEQTDLINAKSWTHDGPYIKYKDTKSVPLPLTHLGRDQLPPGYCLDDFGLIVPSDGTEESHSEHQTSGPDCSATNVEETTTDTVTESMARAGTDAPAATSTGIERGAGADKVQKNNSSATTHTSSHASTSTFIVAPLGSYPPASAVTDTYQPSVLGGSTDHLNTEEAGAGENIVPSKSELLLPSDKVLEISSASKSESAPRRSPRNLSNHIPQYTESRRAAPASLRRPRMVHETPGGSLKIAGAAEGLKHVSMDIEKLKLQGRELSLSWTGVSGAAVKNTLKRPASSMLGDMTAAPQQIPNKKQSVHQQKNVEMSAAKTLSHDHRAHPLLDGAGDDVYRRQAIAELQRTVEEKSSTTRRYHTAVCLLPILRSCKRPRTEGEAESIQLHLLGGRAAKDLMDSSTPSTPILTDRQQPFQWDRPDEVIAEFFLRMGDNDQMVPVQIPSRDITDDSHDLRSLGQVWHRFLGSKSDPKDPWNLLDCACPMQNTVPEFLTGINCQLLAHIRRSILNIGSAKRPTTHRDDWVTWKEIEHWSLLSEGGHCTAPHMDSHGLSTWITVQEGLFGFAWMSRPSEEQRTAWMKAPEHHDEGQQWCYTVLKPGQTIFFPSGTIHAVFRTCQSQTLAFGGHILQWTGIAQWADITKRQLDYPNTTNEDVMDAKNWFPIVQRLIRSWLGSSSDL